MPLNLASTGGGSVTLTVPSTASTFTATVPAVTGTLLISGQASAITSATAVASTSGTSIDYTGIPSWVKRITVMFNVWENYKPLKKEYYYNEINYDNDTKALYLFWVLHFSINIYKKFM